MGKPVGNMIITANSINLALVKLQTRHRTDGLARTDSLSTSELSWRDEVVRSAEDTDGTR
ncbi:unnamed protein product, partial [Pleuronectes platessa]